MFTYQTPPVVEKQRDGWRYRLALCREPGWEPSSLSMRVVPPQGMRAGDVRVDDKPVQASADGSLTIDLYRDRMLTVRLRRG